MKVTIKEQGAFPGTLVDEGATHEIGNVEHLMIETETARFDIRLGGSGSIEVDWEAMPGHHGAFGILPKAANQVELGCFHIALADEDRAV
jgi:hypothetical protein